MKKQQVLTLALLASILGFHTAHARFEKPAKVIGIACISHGGYKLYISVKDYIKDKYTIKLEDIEIDKCVEDGENPFLQKRSFPKDVVLSAAEIMTGLCIYHAPQWMTGKQLQQVGKLSIKGRQGSQASLSAFEILHNEGIGQLLDQDSKDFLYAEVGRDVFKKDRLDLDKLKKSTVAYQVSWTLRNAQGRRVSGVASYKNPQSALDFSTRVAEYMNTSNLDGDVAHS